MSSSVETFQISNAAAEMYESMFVPLLFAQWAPHLIEAAAVRPGQRVLDVACGTGVVARAVASRLNGAGAVAGVDINPGMLAVARRLSADIEWREADAAALPYAAGSFDAVLCQAALMFFPDPEQVLRELARVVTPAGTVALQVWASLEVQPVYSRFVQVAARHAGPDAVRILSAYWILGDVARLRSMFDAAGLAVTSLQTLTETAKFASVDELVKIEVGSTPLGDRLDDDVYASIVEDSRTALRSFIGADGGLDVPIVAHVIAARRK